MYLVTQPEAVSGVVVTDNLFGRHPDRSRLLRGGGRHPGSPPAGTSTQKRTTPSMFSRPVQRQAAPEPIAGQQKGGIPTRGDPVGGDALAEHFGLFRRGGQIEQAVGRTTWSSARVAWGGAGHFRKIG